MGGRIRYYLVFKSSVETIRSLKFIGQMFAIAGVVGMFLQPAIATFKFLKTPGRASKMKQRNILISLSVAGTILGLFCFLPLPFHVQCPFEIQPLDQRLVRTAVPGYLVKWNKQPGDYVVQGEPIATLDNIDLRVQEAKYQSERDLAFVRLRQMQRQLFDDPKMNAMLLQQNDTLQTAEELLRKVKEKQSQLLITSPRTESSLNRQTSKSPKQPCRRPIAGWSGNPFDKSNSHAYFAEGDLLCVLASHENTKPSSLSTSLISI